MNRAGKRLRCFVCGGPAFDCACVHESSNTTGGRGAPDLASFNPHRGAREMMKIRNLFAAVAAASTLAAGSAYAALPAGVTAAITAGGTDGETLMGALAAAGAGLYIVWKILKKAGIML
jgi:hypothetical protein